MMKRLEKISETAVRRFYTWTNEVCCLMEILTILTVVGVTALPWAAAGLLSKLKRCSAPLSLSRPVSPGFGGVVAGLRAAQAKGTAHCPALRRAEAPPGYTSLDKLK